MAELKGTIAESVVKKDKHEKAVAHQEELDHSFKLRMFSATLKSIKRQLPSKCTMLAPFTNSDGELEIMVRVRGNKEAEYFTAPPGLQFMQADIEELVSEITKLF